MAPEELAQLVALAIATYPTMQKQVNTKALTMIWDQLLGHLPYEIALPALAKQMSESEFFPTPAGILKQVEIIRGVQQQATLPSPEAAWQEVLYVVGKVGQYRVPTFTHPSIAQAASALYGGWANLCRNLTTQSMVADRAHFFRLYESYTKQERDQEAIRRLPPKVQQMIHARTANPLLGDGHE